MGWSKESSSSESPFFARSVEQAPITADQQDAIFNWGRAGFDKDIRAGNRPDDAQKLEEFVENSQYRNPLYRGIRTETPLDLKVGSVIDQNGLSSWTAKKDVAEIYASVPIMTRDFELTQGTRYLFVLEKGSKHSRMVYDGQDENAEVIMSAKVKQKITKIVETSPGQFTVYLKDTTK